MIDTHKFSLERHGDKINKRILEGSEADRKDVACFVIQRIEYKLRNSLGKAAEELDSYLHNLISIPPNVVNKYNALSESLKAVMDINRELLNERNEYFDKYCNRFSSELIAA